MIKQYYNGLAAGSMIAIAAAVNLAVGGIAGAIFFSVGLAAILYFQFDLYTGKAGLVGEGKLKILPLLAILGENFLGAVLAGLALGSINTGAANTAYALWQTRLAAHPLILLVKGFFCGILMYFAVTAYNSEKKIEFVILPVTAFILAGFCHSIADMGYLAIASSATDGTLYAKDMWPLIPVIFGNFLGCVSIPLIKRL